MKTSNLDAETACATSMYLARIASRYAISQAILFGSRARHAHRPDSDADVAVIIRGKHGKRSTLAMDMADVAFEVLLETGVLVEALPLWEDELAHPEHFSNPALIEAIRQEGVRLCA